MQFIYSLLEKVILLFERKIQKQSVIVNNNHSIIKMKTMYYVELKDNQNHLLQNELLSINYNKFFILFNNTK